MRLLPSTFAVLLTLAPVLAQEKHTLRLKFVPGHVAHTLSTQEMTIGGGMNMKGVTQMWSEQKVTAVKDGAASLEQKYTRVKVRSDGPMKVDYDSDVAGSKPGMYAAMAKMVGQTMTLRVDPTNKLQEVTVPEDLDMDLERAGMDLKKNFEQAYTAFPADPIAIGDSWTTPMELPMAQMGTMKCTITNKLIEVKDGVVTIEQKMAMDAPDAKAAMKLELTKGDGVTKIDLNTGVPIEMTSNMDMKMGDAMTMSMRMVTKQVEAPAATPATAPPAEAPKTGPK